MLANGHRLPVGGASMIGLCVETGEARVQLDVGSAAVRFDNPLLPETRSELALPLRARSTVIGAMTVQSEREAEFDEVSVATLQAMADQVALAIENARLLSESTAALEAAQRMAGQAMEQAWGDLLHTRGDWGYCYRNGRVVSASGDWSPEMVQAVESGQVVQSVPELRSENGDIEDGVLAIPLKVRDRTVGAIGFRKRESAQVWTAREIQVLQLLVGQMGDALVGAQLYETAQSNAAREQLVGELATRMRQTLDVESVLRTAVQDVRELLGVPEAIVRLASPSTLQRGNGD
jgi:GAF domain-containing protein